MLYLVAARASWRTRFWHLVAASAVLLVISFAWVTAVDLTPASQRLYVGSSTNNSEFNLAFGYNGLERLTGGLFGTGKNSATLSNGTQAGGGFTTGETGSAGLLRLLNTQLGSQLGWLLPLAVIGFFVAAWQIRRFWAATATEGPWLQARPLQDERQASLVLWGIWLLTCAVFFSVASFFHTYYLVMLAPAVAARSGIGTVAFWQQYRESRYGWWLLPASLIAVGLVQIHILADYSAWSRWLSPLIAIVSLLAALGLVLARLWPRVDLKLTLATAVAGVAVLLAAPSAWAADSVANGSSGGDKILTTTGLIRLVKNGTVRYFLLSSGTPKLSAVTVDQLPKATRGQFDVPKGIGGGFFSSSSAATRWVQKSCRVVPTIEWQSRSGSSGGFGGMSQTLYDCGAAR